MTRPERAVEQARAFGFVREVGGPNLGLWVGIFQRFVGIDPGQSWCAAFVCFVLAIVYGGEHNLPIPCTGVCQTIYEHAVAKNMLVGTPQPGDLYLFVNDAGHAHHVGICTDAPNGIAGNTSEDGTSSNGDGVHEHALRVAPANIKYVRLPA